MNELQRTLNEIDRGHQRQLGQYLHVPPTRSEPIGRGLCFLIGIAVGLLLALAGLHYTVAHASEPDAMLGYVMPDPAPVRQVVEPEPEPTAALTMRATHYGVSYEGLRMGCPGANGYRGSDGSIAAVSPTRYSEWPCGTRLLVSGPTGTIVVTRQDACPGCDKHGYPEMIDLSESGHAAVCGENGGTCTVTVQVVSEP